MSVFTMVMGLPSDEKAAWARNYAENNGSIFIDSREVYYELHNTYENYIEDDELWEELLSRTVDRMNDVTGVTLNVIGFNMQRRITFLDELITALDDVLFTHKVLMWLCPYESAIDEDLKNQHPLGESLVMSYIREYEPCWYHEGWDKIELVNLPEVEKRYEITGKLFQSAFEFVTPDAARYSLGEQLARARRYVMRHSCYQVDIWAAEWAKMGKLHCLQIDEDGTISYPGYAAVSAYHWIHSGVAIKNFSQDNPGGRAKVLIVAFAIRWHELSEKLENEPQLKSWLRDNGVGSSEEAVLLTLGRAHRAVFLEGLMFE